MAWFQKATTTPQATPDLHCSFCGESQRRVDKLIAGPKVYICDRCVRLCVDILDGQAAPRADAPSPDLATLRATLARRCVGQERARRALVAALAQHLARLQPDAPAVRPPVVLLAGPHGCGKTTLLRAAVEATPLPAYLADVNRLSATGYVGLDVENLLHELVRRAGGERARAEQGVLALDGLHRLLVRAPPPGAPRDITGESVQRELLRVLDGLDTEVAGAGPRHPAMPAEPFSCARVLAVLAGTFEGLPPSEDEAREDLAGRGLLRELLARVDVVVSMPALTAAELGTVLTREGDGLLPRRLAALASAGHPAAIGDGVVDSWIARAAASPDGGWALHRALAGLAEQALAGGAQAVTLDEVPAE